MIYTISIEFLAIVVIFMKFYTVYFMANKFDMI